MRVIHCNGYDLRLAGEGRLAPQRVELLIDGEDPAIEIPGISAGPWESDLAVRGRVARYIERTGGWKRFVETRA